MKTILVTACGGLFLLLPATGTDVQIASSNLEVSFAPALVKLKQGKGSFTPEVRSAYLDWAQQTVLKQLSEAKQDIPADCLAEIQDDSTLRDAIFGAVDPPDPGILQNYARLRGQLGPAFMAKYKSLVVGAAVAMRSGDIQMEAPLDPKALNQMSAASFKSAEQIAKETLVATIARYMQQTRVSALDLYQKPEEQQKFSAFLQGESISASLVAQIGHNEQFRESLKDAMVVAGQRPPHREPLPDTATWLRYLASNFESTPRLPNGQPVEWPLFSLDEAPWPLLLFFYQPYPLGEARYIMEKYQGQHGPERIHYYGPYREGEDELFRELIPSVWHWNAWPDILNHGGNCVVMAPLGIEAYISLGQPAVIASQPRHSNLMVIRKEGNEWVTTIEEMYSGGPDVTASEWLFNSSSATKWRGNAPSEYMLGLSQGMNINLSSYISTRIMVHLFHHLPDLEKPTLGNTLLNQAIETNPFNPEPFHLQANQTQSAIQGTKLVKLLLEKAQSTEDSTDPKLPTVVDSIHTYWNVLKIRLIQEAILNHHTPQDNNDAQEVYASIKDAPGISAAQIMPYRIAAEGEDAEESRLEEMVRDHISGGKDATSKDTEQTFRDETAYFMTTLDKKERDLFLFRLQAICSVKVSDDPYFVAIKTELDKLQIEK